MNIPTTPDWWQGFFRLTTTAKSLSLLPPLILKHSFSLISSRMVMDTSKITRSQHQNNALMLPKHTENTLSIVFKALTLDFGCIPHGQSGLTCSLRSCEIIRTLPVCFAPKMQNSHHYHKLRHNFCSRVYIVMLPSLTKRGQFPFQHSFTLEVHIFAKNSSISTQWFLTMVCQPFS